MEKPQYLYLHLLYHHQCLVYLYFLHLMIHHTLWSLLLSIHHILVSQSITISNTTVFTNFNQEKPQYLYHHLLYHHPCLVYLYNIHSMIYSKQSSLLLSIHHILVSQSITISNTTVFHQFQCGKPTIIVSSSIRPSSMYSISIYHSFNDTQKSIISSIINPWYPCLPIYHNH